MSGKAKNGTPWKDGKSKGKGKSDSKSGSSHADKKTKVEYVPPTRFERRLSVRPFFTTPISTHSRHYAIGVRTGDRSYSSTDSQVFCRLVGTKGTSPEFQLVRQFDSANASRFERGTASRFSVETDDVGVVTMVHLRQATSDVAQAWFLAYVTVRAEHAPKKQIFPHYKWVFGQEIDLLDGTGALPQQETHAAVARTRRDYIAAMRENYRWTSDDVLKLPGFVADGSPDTLPLDDQYDNVRKKHYYGRLAREITEELDIVNVAKYSGRLTWDNLDDLSLLFFDDFAAPKVIDSWADDAEFGRQALQGCNPIWIKRCDAVPKKMAVDDRLVAKALPKGTSLQSLAKDGRLFLLDYAILNGIAAFKQGADSRHVTAPVCLLYIDDKGTLLPLAIQLHQTGGEKNPVFVPTDSAADWLTAKTWVRCADTQVHQIYSHLLHGHVLVEAFIVAFLRNVHPSHPLYKLLRPHMHNTLAVNVLIRRELIDPNGPTTLTLATAGGGHLKLLEASFAEWSYRRWVIPEDIKHRGVDRLPNYPWRDDALLLWDAMESLVKKIVDRYYDNDGAVGADTELLAFVTELHTQGMKGHAFPAKVTTKAQLIEICTAFIFAATAGYAALNYSQFDAYVSIGNQPRSLYEPPPTNKGEMTMPALLAMLPVGDEAIISIGMAYELSRFSKTQTFLGQSTDHLFSDPMAIKSLAEFQDDLYAISRTIHARNGKSEHPYKHLLPERIPNSITM